MTLPRLHAITDDRVLGLPDFLDRARAIALGPAVALHIRARANGCVIQTMTDHLVNLARDSGTLIVVNDRVDVALLAGAHGVHLPSAGMPAAAVRRLGQHLLVGRSAHSTVEARRADTDWVFLGPIWPTASHPDRPAMGPEALAGSPPHAVAIGGITPRRAQMAARQGVSGVAALRALWDAPDPAAAARALLLSFGE